MPRFGLTSLSLVFCTLMLLCNGFFPKRSLGGDQAAPPAPAYLQSGDEVESYNRTYKERLQRFYDKLHALMGTKAASLLPQLEAAKPKPVHVGYQILPQLTPDAPPPAQRPRATSSSYSWPWTRQLIDREMQKLTGLEAALDHLATLSESEQAAGYEKLLTEYRPLPAAQRLIDSHIQYNRFWQAAIAHDAPGYQRQTALHNAVLERQAIVDTLNAPDETAFRQAVHAIKDINGNGAREVVERELKERELTLAREIHAATDAITTPFFLRVTHNAPHLWIIQAPFYTDVEDAEFLQSFQTAVESVWRVHDGEDEFRVQLDISTISASQLYEQQPAPSKGEPIDLQAHLAHFPADGAVLTTGAKTTHVTGGRCIALGPHDIAPHTLAHEFGHILGFRDVYFRGYRDLGVDGYQVLEVVADPEDIMGAPGSGPVLRHHFEQLLKHK